MEKEKGRIWYFAYGSNLRSSVMAGRGITPFAVEKVVVPSHILTFDVFGLPYSEPAMASVARHPATSHDNRAVKCNAVPETEPLPVHGVVYLLSHQDYLRLIVSEGAGIAYRETEVDAYQICGGGKIVAQTLMARYPFRPNAAPSARYLGLLVQGAVEHELPMPYQNYLKSLPTFSLQASSSRHGNFGARMFLAFWMPLIAHLMRWIKVRANQTGQSPEWMGYLVWVLFSVMWWYHDMIHARIWGGGGGTRQSRRHGGTGPLVSYWR